MTSAPFERDLQLDHGEKKPQFMPLTPRNFIKTGTNTVMYKDNPNAPYGLFLGAVKAVKDSRLLGPTIKVGGMPCDLYGVTLDEDFVTIVWLNSEPQWVVAWRASVTGWSPHLHSGEDPQLPPQNGNQPRLSILTSHPFRLGDTPETTIGGVYDMERNPWVPGPWGSP